MTTEIDRPEVLNASEMRDQRDGPGQPDRPVAARGEEADVAGAVGDLGLGVVLGRGSRRRETNRKYVPMISDSPPVRNSPAMPTGSLGEHA